MALTICLVYNDFKDTLVLNFVVKQLLLVLINKSAKINVGTGT